MILKYILFLNFCFTTYVTYAQTGTSWCGDWLKYKEEKCIKVLGEQQLSTFDEAIKQCSDLDKSTLLTIHSLEEQNFITNLLFTTNKIVNTVWIGLRFVNPTVKYMWIDNTAPQYQNWLNNVPTNKPNYTCVQMSSEVDQLGKWSGEPCNKKNVVVCQKPAVPAIDYMLQILTPYLADVFNKNWIRHKLYTDIDGKHKVLFIPLNENKVASLWDDGVKACATYNASLVEVDSWQKQLIFESFMGLLEESPTHVTSFYRINAKQVSSGQFKWMTSGKNLSFFNWDQGFPTSAAGSDYVCANFALEHFGKWSNWPNTSHCLVVCEKDVNY